MKMRPAPICRWPAKSWTGPAWRGRRRRLSHMPGRKRPVVAELFPGLQRRAAEAHERNPVAEAAPPASEPATGRGKRAVLRTQEEIEADLRALSEQEREEVLSSSHLVA